jgi:alpha-tubulin suppressor-like RCC1 family protein
MLNEESKQVFSFGLNNFGQLGVGTKNKALEPQDITTLRYKNVTAVCAGAYFSLALTSLCFVCFSNVVSEFGQVFSWGQNENGQLCIGTYANKSLPQEVMALKDHKIVAISAGLRHFICVSEEGVVWGTGCNSGGK